jgi:uncharacterized protein YciI
VIEFDQFTVVLLLTPGDPPTLSEDAADAVQDEHLNYLANLHEAGHLLAAGPLPGGDDRFRGLSIFALPHEQALALAENDPAVRAGVFELEVLPWFVPANTLRYHRARFPHAAAEAES